MKVIDILVKWANGEKLPNKIKILENANDYETEWYLYNGQSFQGYAREWDGDIQFFLEYITGDQLNAEIEVLEKNNELEKIRWEEKEILAGSLINNEKIDVLARRTEKLKKNLNEIIDYINEIELKKTDENDKKVQ